MFVREECVGDAFPHTNFVAVAANQHQILADPAYGNPVLFVSWHQLIGQSIFAVPINNRAVQRNVDGLRVGWP